MCGGMPREYIERAQRLAQKDLEDGIPPADLDHVCFILGIDPMEEPTQAREAFQSYSNSYLSRT